LSGREIPAGLPPRAQALLAGFECDLIDEEDVPERWRTRLADEPNRGPVRPQIEALPALVLH
jgi:acetoin utilization protein AcuC